MDRHKPSSCKRSVNRRSFFRQILLGSIDQLEQTGKLLAQRMLNHPSQGVKAPSADFDRPDSVPPPRLAVPVTYLRPPGALPEAQFAESCSRCTKCIEACPAHCIKLGEQVADGLPHIHARQSPCVVCDDLACMNVCPTGALQLVGQVDEIDMGSAVVDFGKCLRSDRGPGQDCRICVNQCPVGDEALRVGDDDRLEVRQGCIGCGVCEWACPTEPASIVVRSSSS